MWSSKCSVSGLLAVTFDADRCPNLGDQVVGNVADGDPTEIAMHRSPDEPNPVRYGSTISRQVEVGIREHEHVVLRAAERLLLTVGGAPAYYGELMGGIYT